MDKLGFNEQNEKVRIGDLTKIRTGKLDANAASDDGEYPFFTCSREPLRISSYSYDCECVLVAGNGDLNVKYHQGKFDAYQRTYIIEENGEGKLYVPYLYFFMERYIEELRKQAIGGVIKYIKLENLTDALIPLPNIETQKQIVFNLSKAKGLIDKRRRQSDELDTLIKARFVEMFGMLGIDVKYKAIPLKDCCIINPKKNNDLRLQDGLEVSFVPMPAVSEHGDIDVSEIRLYEDVKIGFTYFAEGDVLFAKITPCMENGKGAVARNLKNEIGFGSTEFHVLRPVYEMSNSIWLYTLMTFEQFRIDAESKMTGSAGQRRVPASFLENYKVSLPPIELQNQFADFVAQVEKLKVEVQKSLDEFQTVFDSLMQQYFG